MLNLGIFDFILELVKSESPWVIIGLLSITFFSGLIVGLLLTIAYQARAMNKFMGLALKPDSPILRILDKMEGMGGLGGPPIGPDGQIDQSKIQSLVGSVFGALTGQASDDNTDSMGLSRRRRRKSKQDHK